MLSILKNKTFINAHLFKHNLVDVDNENDFKYKNKFTKIAGQLNG